MTVVRPFRPALRYADTTDVIVVGAGMAGLVAALNLAPHRVTLLTKTASLTGGSTAWAQGGIAAAVGDDDTPAAHAADTVSAGAGLNNLDLVDVLTSDGAVKLRGLIDQGAPFDRDEAGQVHLGREAAHGKRRIVHAGGDATGRHIHRWLAQAVTRSGNIAVQPSAFAWDLIVRDGRVCGVLAFHEEGGWTAHLAPFVVLATGGSGQLFRYTTNPAEATADGLAMAARAGARLADLEFVQFHPTALVDPNAADGAPMPLLTEALRGEGAILVDGADKRFMCDEHPDAELAPRDIVARAIWQRQIAGRGAFLDLRAIMSGEKADRFPTVKKFCEAAGFNPAREPVLVAPAAHYHMGGVVSDGHGRTSLEGLWVCGEVAATGVHGANRLASNSLLEGLVFGHRVAEDISRQTAPHLPSAVADIPAISRPVIPTQTDKQIADLRRLMYANVGLQRDGEGLRFAIAKLGVAAQALNSSGSGSRIPTSECVAVRRCGELRNVTLAARLIALAALRRRESRGAHHRIDFPQTNGAVGERQYLTIDDLGAGTGKIGTIAPAATGEGLRDDASTTALSA